MNLQTTEELLTALSDNQRQLINEGIFLAQMMQDEHPTSFTDYSFVVFPFAKAFEGFLKQEFLNAGFITQADYTSTHFRLGKVMSPNLARRLGNRSVYHKVCATTGWCELADEIWETWKLGRNEVFHYFPHNLKSLNLTEAVAVANQILTTMDKVWQMAQSLKR